MAETLQGKRVAMLAADGVEQVELVEPWQALEEAGATVELLSTATGQIQATNKDINPAGRFDVDRAVGDATVDEFTALVLPGGTSNPDNLRMDSTAVDFVRDFVISGKLVAAICHGPWTLVEADVVRNRTLTSYPSIRTDMRNAGGNVVDEEVCIDDALITSRDPNDLPAFSSTIVDVLARTAAPA